MENYTKKKNLRFINIPEKTARELLGNNNNIIENEFKISNQEIRFHAFHRVGKPATQNDDNPTANAPEVSLPRIDFFLVALVA